MASTAAAASTGVYRDGKNLIVTRGAELPPICFRCGQAATGGLVLTKFYWHERLDIPPADSRSDLVPHRGAFRQEENGSGQFLSASTQVALSVAADGRHIDDDWRRHLRDNFFFRSGRLSRVSNFRVYGALGDRTSSRGSPRAASASETHKRVLRRISRRRRTIPRTTSSKTSLPGCPRLAKSRR